MISIVYNYHTYKWYISPMKKLDDSTIYPIPESETKEFETREQAEVFVKDFLI